MTKPQARAEQAWCTDPAVRVLAGVAGAGKSRLAVEAAGAQLEGWTGGIARPGRAAQILPAPVDAQQPVLIVVDDPNTESAADIALYRQAEGEQRVQVRVLLVVRDVDAFDTVLDEYLSAGARETTTLPLITADDDRRRVFTDAVRAFDGLSDDAPLPSWAEAKCGPVGADGEPTAVITARAALAVLAQDPDRAVAMCTADLDRLIDEILMNERERWQHDGVEPDAQEEAALTLLLLLRGPRTIEDAVGALRTLPRFRDRDDVHRIAVRVRSLYPGATDEPWPAPRPNLARAALLTAAIERHRSQVDAALDDDPRVFLRIARAAACSPRLAALAHPLLTDARLVALTEAAMHTDRLSLRDDLVETLGRALDGADVERLLPITEAPTCAPARAALRRAEAQQLRAQTADDGPRLASALAHPGAAGRDTGAHTEALTPTRPAVELYRDLGDQPADLTRALPGLGASVQGLGSHDDLRAAVRDAVQLTRDLYAPGLTLARSLTGLAVTLTASGAHAEALAAVREAVQRCRDLAAARPARHYPDLAADLAALSASLGELGALDEAATVMREAVRLYRDVGADNAERHRPDLARSLTDLGAVLREIGAHDEALTASREAVQHYQDLAAAHRNRHLPDLARSLGILGACLQDAGSYTASLAAVRDAVRLTRELAAYDPARHTPDLARSLTHLGIALRGRRPYEESLAPGVEAVQLNRELAAADPARHTPELARSLTERGISLRALGRHHDALAVTGEAVHLGRHLAAAEPARHTADIARFLISLGAGLRALGRRSEAVLHEGEAVAWWWQLTQRCPGEFDDRYHDAQRRFLRTFCPYDRGRGELLTAEFIGRAYVNNYLEGAGDRQADAKSEALVERRGRT